MAHSYHTTSQEAVTTPAQIAQWAQALTSLHARIAPRFVRPEPRRRALAYLQGLLGSVERKNGWQLAEHAREQRPYGMQRLLSQAMWDADLVRDDLRTYVRDTLGEHNVTLVIDETSFPKRGKKSAGVQEQYCGTSGLVQNCQVGVFLTYVSEKGHTLIDRELYLPLSWIQDPPRCQQAGVPSTTRFQTKCELAQRMLERAFQAQLPVSWVVADTVYGNNVDLRSWLEHHQYSFVAAVSCDHLLGLQTMQGRQRLCVTEIETQMVKAHEWQRLSMSEGTKGPRCFDWALVPILHRWRDDQQHWLLIRRVLTDPAQKTYYLVFAPPHTTIQAMVKAIGQRWSIEEDFETAKDLGLDHYEVRSWTGWYRHMTLCMLAQACLTMICKENTPQGSSAPSPLVAPLTRPEVRHLLAQLIWPHPHHVHFILAWSWWRRYHRSRACYYHTKRRLQAG